jgi:hypothetical protein
MRVFATRGNIWSTLANSCSRLTDRGMRVEKTLMQTARFSTLMQLLFLFDRLRHESLENPHANRSLLNSHATLVLVWPIEAWEFRKPSCKPLASQLSCNSDSCSCLTEAWKLRKLSCKLSLLNSHATLVLVWSRHESLENSHTNSSLLNSHATLILVWSRHESWENPHTNRSLLNSHATLVRVCMRVEKTLMQTLTPQLSFSFDQGLMKYLAIFPRPYKCVRSWAPSLLLRVPHGLFETCIW